MSEPIDSLELEISASSGQAEQGLDKLINALGRLKSGSKEAKDEVAAFSSGLSSFVEQTAKLKSIGENFKVLSEGGKALSALKNVKLPTKFAEQLEQIKKSMQGYQAVNKGLESISTSLERIGKLGDVKIPGTIAKRITEISNAVKDVDDDAIRKLDSITASLQRLSGVDLKGLPAAMRALNSAKKVANTETVAPINAKKTIDAGTSGIIPEGITEDKGISEATDKIKETGNAAEDASNKISTYRIVLRNLGKAASDAVDKGINKLTSGIKKFAKSAVKDFVSPVTRSIADFNKWKAAIGRVAFYRTVRTAIKMVTDGLKEGIQNLYYYSQIMGTAFAPAMDSLASSAQYLKNSFGAMVSPLIEAVAPAVEYLIDKFVQLLNTINMAFAALTGKSTYTRALRQSVQYGDDLESSMGGAADAAKEFKKYLIGIDELTIIPDQNDSGRGGGSGGGIDKDYGTMFEEVELPDKLQDFAQKIKDAISKGDWYGAGADLADKLNSLITGIDAEQWGEDLGAKIQNGVSFALGFIRNVQWEGMGGALASFVNGLLASVVPEDVGALLASKIQIAVKLAYGFVKKFDFSYFGTWLAGVVNGWFGEIDWDTLGETVGGFLTGVLDTAINFLQETDWKAIGEDFAALLNNVNWEEVITKGINAIQSAISAVSSVASSFLGNLNGISSVVVSIGTGMAAWKMSTSLMNWFDKLSEGKFSSALNSLNTSVGKVAAGLTLTVTGLTIETGGAYSIGYDGASLSNVIQTAIGAALTVAGSLLAFGTGPLGWTVGLGLALTTSIVSFVMGYNKKKVEKEAKTRFGEIELTVDQAKAVAEKEMQSELSVNLTLFINAQNTAQDAFDDYLASNENFGKIIWEASVGVSVSQDEAVASLENLINSAKSAIEAKQYAVNTTISIGFTDSNVQAELTEAMNSKFTALSEKLDEKGTELRQVLDDAFADGVLDEKEKSLISKLQGEYNQILEEYSTNEFKAKVATITLGVNFTKENISFESVSKVADELVAEAQEQLDQSKQLYISAQLVVQDTYEEGSEEYVKAMQDALETYINNQSEIIGNVWAPLKEKISSAFTQELSSLDVQLNLPVSTWVSDALNKQGLTVNGSISNFMDEFSSNFSMNIQNLSGTLPTSTKNLIKDTVKGLEPTEKMMEDLAAQARAAGVAVPENISKGLKDIKMLKALAGDQDSINYLIGQKLSTDQTALKAIASSKDFGTKITGSIATGLLDNATITKNIDGTFSLVTDEFSTQIAEVTPELKEMLKGMGLDLDTLDVDVDVNGNKGTVDSTAQEFIDAGKQGYMDTTVNASLTKSWGDQKTADLLGLENLNATVSSVGPSNKDEWNKNKVADALSLKGLPSTVSSISPSSTSWNGTKAANKLSLLRMPSTVSSVSPSSTSWNKKKSADALSLLGLESTVSKVNKPDGYSNKTESAKSLHLTGLSASITKVENSVTEMPEINVKARIKSIVDRDKTYTMATGGLLSGGKWHPIQNYASGGLMRSAQLFFARENGLPELVGRIGSNTAVMNNGQIVSSVASGVYQAVSAAFGQLGGYFGTIASGMSRIPEAISSISMEDDRKYLYFPSHNDVNVSAARTSQTRDTGNDGAFSDGMRSANEDVISVIFAAATRIVTAIQENGGDVYMDSEKVGQKTTQVQNRNSRIYGHAVQNG